MDHYQDPDDEPENDDSKVGYRNPPRHTRWRPGECPNPAGRPKNAKGRGPILDRIANEMCEVQIGGKIVSMTRLEVLLTAVRNATANGNPAAQKLFDELLREVTEEGQSVPKGILIVGERISQDEWESEYGHLGHCGEPPPSRRRGLMPVDQQAGVQVCDADPAWNKSTPQCP